MIKLWIFSSLFFLFSAVSLVFGEEDSVVIAKFMDGGVKWSLIRVVDGVSGALFVEREEKGISQIVAGDSLPFPLSNFGLEPKIARKLAELYVDYEIKTHPKGIEGVREQVQQREKLPHDLLEAYGRYISIDAQPVYGTNQRGLEDMKKALELVRISSGGTELKDRISRRLDPLKPDLMIQLSNQPDTELGEGVIRAVAAHPSQQSLREICAVYAGRQSEHFLESLAAPRLIIPIIEAN